MLRIIKQAHLKLSSCPFRKSHFNSMSTVLASPENLDLIPAESSTNKRSIEDEDNSEISAKKYKMGDIRRKRKRNFAMMLSYLGKDYFGMQRNPSMRTIEEDLIKALFTINLIGDEAFEAIQTINFQRAARTDKGVSATRQIVSLKLPEEATKEMINEHLPEVIRVFGLRRVTKGFNSKAQCNARSYSYTLPTYAFAPDDPSILRPQNGPTTTVELQAREEYLQTIDNKPYTDFRLSPEHLERLKTALKAFEGTHNFHNFTSKVRPLDPRANRYIINFTHSDPYTAQGIEFITLTVKGQSFMLHQIRKMVAMTIGVMRNLIPPESIEKAFDTEKLDIPIAPGLGLVLDFVHYDNYNRRYGNDGMHETLEWKECEEDVMKFHKEYILRHIEDTEIKEKSMFNWLITLAMHTYGPRDQHKSDEEPKDESSEA